MSSLTPDRRVNHPLIVSSENLRMPQSKKKTKSKMQSKILHEFLNLKCNLNLKLKIKT